MYLPTVPRHTAFPRYDPIIGEYFERMTNAYLTLRKRAFLSSTLTGIGSLWLPHDVRTLSVDNVLYPPKVDNHANVLDVYQRFEIGARSPDLFHAFQNPISSIRTPLVFASVRCFQLCFPRVIAVAVDGPHCIKLSEKYLSFTDNSQKRLLQRIFIQTRNLICRFLS